MFERNVDQKMAFIIAVFCSDLATDEYIRQLKDTISTKTTK